MKIELLSEKQAARVLSIHPGTLRLWRRNGEGPPWIDLAPHRKRPVVRYRADELQRWIDSREGRDGNG